MKLFVPKTNVFCASKPQFEKKSKRAQSKNWQKKTWIELEENSKFLKHLESCVEFSYHNSRFHGLSWSNRREKTKYPVGKNCWLRVLLKKRKK